MTFATEFLKEHWRDLELSQVTSPERVSCVMLTPCFPASRHVLFLLLCEGMSNPALIMKISRVPGEDSSLKREGANLRVIHGMCDRRFASIPRMVAFGGKNGHSVLVETALAGISMDPVFVRQRTGFSIEAVLDWLISFHKATATCNGSSPGWFSRAIDRPLEHIESALRLSADEKSLVCATRELAETLRCANFPLVFSHGDLSHPNILALREGGVGVVDWEMAEPQSLPATDLFFFLNFVATARWPWKSAGDVSGFRAAFFSDGSWARRYIARYAEAMQLSGDMLSPLFVLGFSRYLSETIARMSGPDQLLDSETAAWLRTDRAYILWREAVQHASQLRLS